ncbi:hypothetical protein BH24GEM3_BH24GEM3_24110 [soil metagenome]
MTHHYDQHDRPAGLGEAALKGAVAGVLGGAAMMMAMKLGQQALLPEGEQMEPPPKKLVETLAERQGVELSDTQAMAAGMGVHLGYSALWGAIYGAVQSRLHPPDALHGLLLGGLVYASSFPEFGLLPKLGVLPPPTQQSLEKAALPVGAHLVFGLATAAAFAALE